MFFTSPSFVSCRGIVLVMSLCFRHAVKKSKRFFLYKEGENVRGLVDKYGK